MRENIDKPNLLNAEQIMKSYELVALWRLIKALHDNCSFCSHIDQSYLLLYANKHKFAPFADITCHNFLNIMSK